MTIDDRITRLLREAAQDVESKVPPPVERVIAQGRRRRLIRGSTGGVIAVGTALVMVWSLVLLARGLGGPSEPRRAAADGAATGATHTLILSDVTVRYPFSSAPEGEVVEKDDPSLDRSMANVFFTATWSDDRWPGEVWCTFQAFDARGNVVGRERVLVGAPILGRTGRLPGFGMHVSAEPVSATGSCEETDYVYPDGPGYVFDDVRIKDVQIEDPRGVGAEIRATVRWATTVDPGPRACTVEVTSVDGTVTTTGEFTLQGPDGYQTDLAVIAMPADRVDSARIDCRPLPRLLP
jgi:hypothetical protein